MANVLYNKAKEALLTGSIVWSTDNIKAVLIDTGEYNFSASHQFLSDIPSAARIATSANLSSKTSTDGVADAADATYSAVSGATVEAIALYKDTGTASTSRLLYYIDTGTSGLPFTPNGGDIIISWNASGIFRL